MSQIDLIKLLSDGEFHAGSEVGEILGVTRAAIWKQVQKLQDFGLEVESIRGKGYRLKQPLNLLDAKEIKSQMQRSPHLLSALETHDLVSSTNDLILNIADSKEAQSGHVCLAEYQEAGRGRRGRQWVSPFASNIYLSMLWRFAGGAAALEGLSLAVGLAVVKGLKEMGVSEAHLKWPNDILVSGKKICGVLIEMTGDASGSCSVVIGIGINVQMPKEATAQIDQPWTDISSSLGRELVDRNEITARILDHVLELTHSFSQHGFGPLYEEWNSHDGYHGESIKLIMGDTEIYGIGRGVGPDGGIKIETPDGKVEVYKGGEISLRLHQ